MVLVVVFAFVVSLPPHVFAFRLQLLVVVVAAAAADYLMIQRLVIDCPLL